MDENDGQSRYGFPFKPYNIQLELMECLYTILETKKIGILESPTGTGKSLSLICGTLTWLKDFDKKVEEELTEKIFKLSESGVKNESNWFDAQLKANKSKEELNLLRKQQTKRVEYNQKILRIRDSQSKKSIREQQKISESIKENEKEPSDYDEFLLVDIDEKNGDNEYEPIRNPNDEPFRPTTIFFASRTHSQLQQVINEIKKTKFAGDIMVTSLASRANVCVNEGVLKLRENSLINDRCVELQRNSKPKVVVADNPSKKRKTANATCPYLNQANIQDLSEHILVNIEDMSKLLQHGRKSNACPYYASRKAANLARLILVPYNLLLHKETRLASSIDLKDSVIIIDEAHNLLETISSMHSPQINNQQINGCLSQVTQYLNRYEERLSPANLFFVEQIIFVLRQFTKRLHSDKQMVPVTTVGDFMIELGIEHVNFFKLLQFCRTSQLSKKLHGFSKFIVTEVKPTTTEKQGGSVLSKFLSKAKSEPQPELEQLVTESKPVDLSPLFQFEEVLAFLTNEICDGRVVVEKRKSGGVDGYLVKCLLLNPAEKFSGIVSEARSIILAGGTMQPTCEFVDRLLVGAGVDRDRIVEHSCGHIVDTDRVLPIVLTSGPSGKEFNFTHSNRSDMTMVNELGRCLLNLSAFIPGGIVVFFPSYEVANLFYQQLESSGILAKLEEKKRVFKESKSSAKGTDILTDYAKAIKLRNGAILFSIVNGKLSEGINFSDELARCVVMVGLPYPNKNSPELMEVMNYLNRTTLKVGSKSPGDSYYDNLCIKAVNQCIGRAIRHINDYAAILLLDVRYSGQSIQSGLPLWIRQNLRTERNFGIVLRDMKKFFQTKG